MKGGAKSRLIAAGKDAVERSATSWGGQFDESN